MPSLALALLVTAAVSFACKSTRPIGVLCTGLFTYACPAVACGLLVLGLACFFFFRRR